MTTPQFSPVELPDAGNRGPKKSEFRKALESQVGEWFVYPGSNPNYCHSFARQANRGRAGGEFEATSRGGVGYVRCIKGPR